MFNIKKAFLSLNKFSRPGIPMETVKGIVIHWVGNPNSTAIANRNYWESLKDGKKSVYSSAHYIIGLEGEIVQAIPESEIAYHAGTSFEKASPIAKSLFNNRQNYHTIGIEHCHIDWNGNFTESTYKTSVEFVASLLKKYGLGVDSIFRHYDMSGKDCPKLFVNQPEKYEKYKKDVSAILNPSGQTKEAGKKVVKVAVGVGFLTGIGLLIKRIFGKG